MAPINEKIIQLLIKCEALEYYEEVSDCTHEYLAPITYMHFCSVIVLLKRFPQQ